MKALKYGFGLILVGGFALTASCGGSSGDDSSSSAGSSSTTGGTSSTGGTFTSTGGTFTSGGGTTGNTTGGTVGTTGGTSTTTGGTSTTTGGTSTTTGGTGAGGGTTMNPAGCPATAPAIPARGMPGETCTPLANRRDRCSYVTGTMTETCTCNVPFTGPGGGQAGAATTDGTWACFTATTPIACPAMPMTGDACTQNCRPAGSRQTCTCRNGTLTCPGGIGAAGAGG